MQAGPLETKWVSLGDIANLKAGFGFPKIYQGKTTGAYPFAKVGDISRAGRTGTHALHRADHYVDESDLKLMKASTVPAGSVLFAKIGEAIRQEHRVVAECALAIDNNAMAAVPGPLVESRYLFRFLQTVNLYAMASSTTVPSLRKSQLSQIHVPLPPLPEQHRIAAILDKADRLRTQRREALAHLDALTHSIFNDTFGDPVSNELGWPKEPMSALLSSIESGRSPVCRARPAADGEWGVLKLGAISTQSWLPNHNKALADSQPDPRLEVKAGDVLFSRKNTPDLVAAVCLVNRTPPRLLLPDLIFRLCIRDPDTISNVYLASVLQHVNQRGEIQALASGSAQSMVNISKAKVMTIDIPVPPPELQHTFARRVASVERLKEQHRAQLAELDALFASLQHRAFRGEL
jgi:type I restriction enzyme, S subunit